MSETNGERGPKGDHGQAGDAGEQGRQGEPGLVSQGERGPTGDRGQSGDVGRTGKAGPDPTRKLLIMFVFLAVIATTYGVILQQAIDRIDENTSRIEQTVVRVEQERLALLNDTCIRDLAIQTQYNTLLDALIAVDEEIRLAAPNLPAAALEGRIAAYEAGKIVPSVCEPVTP